MIDPKDPSSFPILTDVIVPGRPPIGRPVEADAPEAPPIVAAAHGAADEPAGGAASASAPEPAAATPAPASAAAPAAAPAPGASPEAASSGAAQDEPRSRQTGGFDERDAEFVAERVRSRFAAYLRTDARGVIEARCREAVEEHTNWLVRQVTREVVLALEAEVASWVRDAVREELAQHASRR